MDRYYVNPNAQPTGEHEVHKKGCYWLSLILSPIYLGLHWTCQSAVSEARRYYPNVDGCIHCIPECHTR